METVKDFEDILALLERHRVRYLVIGGLAFIYHAKPRYTKDMDLWVDPASANIKRANRALAEFGSLFSLDATDLKNILQLGVPPNRIDFLLDLGGFDFAARWKKRERGSYGKTVANWIDIDSLIEVKSRIHDPRHRDDVRVLRKVKRLRSV